jgi:hypothetical protein
LCNKWKGDEAFGIPTPKAERKAERKIQRKMERKT